MGRFFSASWWWRSCASPYPDFPRNGDIHLLSFMTHPTMQVNLSPLPWIVWDTCPLKPKADSLHLAIHRFRPTLIDHWFWVPTVWCLFERPWPAPVSELVRKNNFSHSFGILSLPRPTQRPSNATAFEHPHGPAFFEGSLRASEGSQHLPKA